MKEWLDMQAVLQQYPQLDSLADGQQAKFNHVGCSAGRDTKHRLVVRRDGNTLVAWCHHCQARGVHGGDASATNYTRKRRQQLNSVQSEVHLPHDIVYGMTEFPPLANVWLNQYGITMDERQQFGIGWSAYYGRVVLPVYMNEGLVAFQLRRIMPDDDGPKYLTVRKAGVAHPMWQAGQFVHGGVMVLTEDMLSAIKVSRVANATAMLGTTTPQDNLAYILRFNPDVVLMWFDDDNPDVKAKQRVAHRRIGAFVTCHIYHSHGRDPKEYTTEEIQEVIRAYTPGA